MHPSIFHFYFQINILYLCRYFFQPKLLVQHHTHTHSLWEREKERVWFSFPEPSTFYSCLARATSKSVRCMLWPYSSLIHKLPNSLDFFPQQPSLSSLSIKHPTEALVLKGLGSLADLLRVECVMESWTYSLGESIDVVMVFWHYWDDGESVWGLRKRITEGWLWSFYHVPCLSLPLSASWKSSAEVSPPHACTIVIICLIISQKQWSLKPMY